MLEKIMPLQAAVLSVTLLAGCGDSEKPTFKQEQLTENYITSIGHSIICSSDNAPLLDTTGAISHLKAAEITCWVKNRINVGNLFSITDIEQINPIEGVKVRDFELATGDQILIYKNPWLK